MASLILCWAIGCIGCEREEPVGESGHFVVACVDTVVANQALEEGFRLAISLSQPIVNKNGTPIDITVVPVAVENNPRAAETGFKRAMNMYKPKVIVGGSYSELAIPMSRLAEQYKIPFLTTMASSREVDSGMEYTFMTSPVASMYAEAAVYFLLNNLKLSSFGILSDSSDQFTIEISNTLRQSYALSGGGGLSYFNLHSQEEFEEGIKELAEANPDCIFVATLDYELPEVIAELKKNGYKGVLFSGDPFDAIEPTTNKPMVLDMPVYFIFYWDEDYTGEVNLRFLRGLLKDSKLPPSEHLATSFDTALRLVTAIKSSKGTSSADIQKALTGLTFMEGASGNYSFASRHTLKSCWVFKLENGELTRQAKLNPQTSSIH